VGSSSEVNSENTKRELEEFDGTLEEPDEEVTVDKSYDSQKDLATGSSGISRSIHQLCVIITKAAEENGHADNAEIDMKSTNQELTVKRRRRKFMSPTGSGESSCQLSTTGPKYPPIQEGKF
jgi:hypothetical protein